jgi:Carboxypeptidase regulatory-like domain/TonB-dependent Receptor Plug Domain
MRSHLWWLAFVLWFAISDDTFGQDTASITGTVRDPTGASIPDARVTVSSAERGIHRVNTTNKRGEYLVSALPPGSYNLTIAARGFKNFKAEDVILRVAQKARADATLEIGVATTETRVEGTQVAQVETQSSELAGTVTAKQITQLELNGRNFTQLVTLVPGVSGGTDEGLVGIQFLPFNFNGGRLEYNNWEVDGGDILDNGSNQSLNIYPSIDAIAEVRVLTSNYGAQYGRNGSGTVETETKSGTNKFHGDVYEFVRNDIFNARNYFDPPGAPPAYKKNDFGYTIGGPIFLPAVYNTKRDKSFFFWSQEWRIERVPGQTFNVPVPSLSERSGNFSDLCPNPLTGSFVDCPINPDTNAPFDQNQVPVDFNARFLLPMIPEPNAGVPGAELFSASPRQPFDWREEMIRIDQNFSSRVRAMFRFIHDSSEQVTATPFPFGGSFPTIQAKVKGPGTSIVTRLNTNASNTLLNEFVFSYTTDHLFITDQGSWERPPNMTMTGLFDNGFGGKLPGIFLFGGVAYGGFFSQDPGPVPWKNSNPTYTYRDNVSKFVGKHNLQFGAYAVTAQKNEELLTAPIHGLLGFDVSRPVSTGNPFADLLVGRIGSFLQSNRQPKYYNRYKILEPYFQDDWRINNHLTLNLGLHVSLFGTYRERYKQVSNFDPSVYNPADAPSIDANGALVFPPGQDIKTVTGIVQCGAPGVPPGCLKGHLFNPAPRIGFAYDPRGNGRTAIRGGYGIFWEHANGSEANTESLQGSPPLVLTANQLNIVGYTSIGAQGLFFPLSVTSIPNHAVWPYMQQWHMDVQRQMPKSTVATVSYVGSKGTHLGLQRDLNQVHATPLSLNRYKPGEPIGGLDNSHDDCGTMTTPSGVSVVGEAALHLAIACGADPSPFRPYVGFASIERLEEAASSTYHALQVSIRRSVGGLQFSVAYTYSHSIDDSSDRFDSNFVDSYNLHANRASSNFDQRHILNIGYVYDMPFPRSSGFANKFFAGWQISGITSLQTGAPFSVTNNANFSDNAGVGNGFGSGSYADLIGDPKSQPSGKFVEGVPGPLLFNPGAYAAPRGLTFGNSGRNSLRNPRRTNFNVAMLKHFPVSEAKSFEFRTEAFNVFNHTQWAGINSALNCYAGPTNFAGDPSCIAASNFLHPESAHSSRILQFGLKFIF